MHSNAHANARASANSNANVSEVATSKVSEAVEYLRPLLGQVQPKVAIVCGSGWRSLSMALQSSLIIPLASIPHVPLPRVVGHGQSLMVGMIGECPVILLLGRLHWYEGHDLEAVVFLIRVLCGLGGSLDTLLLTNAAGSLNPDLQPGDLMVIEDHISLPSLCGLSPLRGHAHPFVSLTAAYWPQSYAVVEEAARGTGLTIKRGVYAHVGGPAYETPAEVRLLRRLGGDAVGMSTVPEVIAAKHAGLPRIMALSLITNTALDSTLPEAGEPNHAEVLAEADKHQASLRLLLEHLLPRLATNF